MAAPTIKGTPTTTIDTDGGASSTVSRPTGAATGDVYVIVAVGYSAGFTVASFTSTGFTELASVARAPANAVTVTVLGRIYDGTEGATWTVSNAGGESGYTYLSAFVVQDVDVSGTITAALDSSAETTTGSATSLNLPEETTVSANTGVFAAVANYSSTITNTPTGWTQQVSLENAFRVWSKTQASAGSTGTESVTFAATTEIAAAVWAFKEASSGPDATATPSTIACTTTVPSPTVTVPLVGPTVIQSTTGSATTASPAVTFSTAPLENDIVVLFCSRTVTGQTLTIPSGWENPLGTTTDVESDAHQVCMVAHRVTAGEAGASTVTFTATNLYGTSVATGVIGVTIRGVDTTTMFDQANSAFASTNTGTAHVLPGLTPGVTDGLLISGIAADAAARTFTEPAGWTVATNQVTTSGSWVGAYDTLTTNATPISDTSITANTGDEWAAISVVFAPPSGTPAAATPATVATSVGVASPTVSVGVSLVASVVAAVCSVLAPTVSTAAGADVTPATVATVATVPAPTAFAGTSTTATPATVTIVATVPTATAVTPSGLFPAAVSTNGRYLVDQNGDPWLGVGDTAWSLVGQLTNTEITSYMTDRAAKGVNLILFSAPEPFFADNAPNNIDNDAPFTGTAFQSTLNNDYWLRVDHAVDTAESLGITLLICPFYLGYPSTSEGWDTEVAAATNAQMATYAGYLSARYGAYNNIMWLVGHDRVPNTTEKARGNAWADQMQTDTDHLITCGGLSTGTLGGSGSGVTDWASSGVSADFDTNYTYSEEIAEESYDLWANAIPFGFFEGRYEFESGTVEGDVLLREQMWAAWAAGACYIIFGNDPIWFFDATAGEDFGNETQTWENSLDLEGSTDMAAFATITGTLGDAWAATSADTASTFVTTQGTGTNRVGARFGADYGLVYHPAFSAGTITLDLTEFATNWSTVTVTRYDVRSGATTTVGTYATSGTQALSAPAANSAGDNDWLFVVTGAAPIVNAATVAATVAVPAPTVSTAANANVTASTVAAVVAVPSVTPSAGSTASPSTVATVAAVPAPTLSASATATPGVVATTTAVDAPTLSAGATAAPSTVASTSSVGAPTVSAGSTVTTTTVATVATVPVPAITAGGAATVAASTVPVVVAVPAPTMTAGSTASPSTVTTVVTVASPTVTSSASVAPTTTASVAAIPAPSVTTAGNANVAPNTVAATVAVPAPTVTSTGNATVTPSTVATLSSIGTPGVTAAAEAAPSTVTATVAVGTPTLSVGSNIPAPTVTVVASVNAPGRQYAPGHAVWSIAAETRTLTIPADDRTFIVPLEARTLEVPDGGY